MLHPRHKLHYFKEAGWDAEWIKTAEGMLRTKYMRSYAPQAGDDDEDIEMLDVRMSPKKASVCSHSWSFDLSINFVRCDQASTTNMFDDLPALKAPKRSDLVDEITAYLATGPESVKDVLKWWKEKKTTFPHLSRMALDYLTIPSVSWPSFIMYASNAHSTWFSNVC